MKDFTDTYSRHRFIFGDIYDKHNAIITNLKSRISNLNKYVMKLWPDVTFSSLQSKSVTPLTSTSNFPLTTQ